MLLSIIHSPHNFQLGWILVLCAFISGAIIGLRFHRDDFLGGYASLQRRMLRLGHIALAALGLFNVVFAISVPRDTQLLTLASICFMVGGVAMPAVCFLTAWQARWRHLFFVPVAALIFAIVFILLGVSP